MHGLLKGIRLLLPALLIAAAGSRQPAVGYPAARLSLCYEIQGDGYLRLERGEEIVYARGGGFAVRGGLLVHDSGLPLSPPVRVPADATKISLSPDGFVIAQIGGGAKTLSRVVLARFDGSPPVADGKLWVSTSKPKLGHPGAPGFGVTLPLARATPATPSRYRVPPGCTHVVIIRDASEVSAPTFAIGHVANVSGPEPLASRICGLVIGTSPRPGEKRIVTTATIQGALRAARIDIGRVSVSAPSGAGRQSASSAVGGTVSRASRLIRSDEIEAFARGWIQANLPEAGPVSLSARLFDKEIADGRLTMRVKACRSIGSALILSVEGTVSGERQFQTQLVFGKGARAGSEAGLPAVKAGQVVRVLLVSNGITVETTGKARSRAAVGELVTVTIEQTKAVLAGVLKPDGVVEVKL